MSAPARPAWPEMLAGVLVAAGGGALLGSLFVPWAEVTLFSGTLEGAGPVDGWELFDWADAVMVVLAVALGLFGLRPPRRRVVLAGTALLCAAAVATIVGHGFPDTLQRRGGALRLEPAFGPWIAFLGLTWALAGLLLLLVLRQRERGRAASGA